MLVKLFVRERGSEALESYLASNDYQAIASALIALETESALQRRLRSREVTREQVNTASANTLLALNAFLVHSVSASVLSLAMELIRSHAIRSLDAIQLSTALLFLKSETEEVSSLFLSSDHRLLDAARSEGLAVWTPELTSVPDITIL